MSSENPFRRTNLELPAFRLFYSGQISIFNLIFILEKKKKEGDSSRIVGSAKLTHQKRGIPFII